MRNGYLEDLALYSKGEFWKALQQAERGKVNRYKSVKEFMQKNGH